MKIKKLKKGLALFLGLALAAQLPASRVVPGGVVDAYAYTGTATVKASSLNVRSGPGTGYSVSGRLAAGSSVQITGEKQGSDGKTWYQIQYRGNGGSVASGYVLSSYLRLPVSYSADANFEAYLTSQGFPESYKNGLRQLHAQYPNWVFVSKDTGLDWNTVIENESVLGRNLVAKGSISSWKSVESGAYNWDTSTWTGFDGSNWVAASKEIIEYYMDPRNFLDETYVFQFLAHEYNPSIHTKEGLESMVTGTFLSGTTDSTGTGGSDFSGGSGPSGRGPGSSGSAQVSDTGPGGHGKTDDSNNGPGVSRKNSSQAGSQSPAGGSIGNVSLEAPSASISHNRKQLLSEKAQVITGAGAAPGASESGSQGSQSPSSSGSGSQSSQSPSSPGSGSQSSQSPSSPGNGNQSSQSPSSPGSGNQSSQSPSSPGSGSQNPGSSSSQPSGTDGTATYTELLMKAAQQSGVSPYVLAAMILQEQGNSGGSPLISGTYSGYEGYYNFFNVEAYQSGSMSPIQMGLRYASQSGSYGRPWNTVEKSILGGAQNYGDNYMKAGQNTFYLKKFNVQGSNLYKHQYMSNIQGAASEAAKLSQAYTDAVKNSALEFHIPIYRNMPEQACTAPTGDGSPNNKLSSLEISGYSLTPSFHKDTESYSLIVNPSVSSVTVNAGPADSQAQISGAGTVNLPSQSNSVTISVTAQNGSVRNYTINIVKQDGAPSSGGGTAVSPGGSQGPGASSGPGSSGDNTGGPGGSNVTIVEVP